MTVRLLVGDVRDRIREIPDSTVDLVVTSPPFLALRKYGDNAAEMGSEGTPADFLDALLDLTQEFRRALTPHGSIAVELGDTYSGSGGAGGDYGDGGMRDLQPRFAGSGSKHRMEAAKPGSLSRMAAGAGWPLAKSLVLVPGLYASSLAYGRNLLNPAHTFDPWRVRNIITWCRPNPPVGALGDKVRPATSYITVACTSAKRWFDLDAVREPSDYDRPNLRGNGSRSSGPPPGQRHNASDHTTNPAGAPPLDWWDDALDPDDPTDHMTMVLPTQPYPGAHYATWPAKLAQRLIEMMCPLKVCTTCGKPSERITMHDGTLDPSRPQAARAMALAEAGGLTQEHLAAVRAFGISDAGKAKVTQNGAGKNSDEVKRLAAEAKAVLGGYFREFLTERPKSVGWSDCGHNTWRPGHVLDPFSGSGTTLAVAQGLGRSATGIELYPANADLIRERVGMFLEVVA